MLANRGTGWPLGATAGAGTTAAAGCAVPFDWICATAAPLPRQISHAGKASISHARRRSEIAKEGISMRYGIPRGFRPMWRTILDLYSIPARISIWRQAPGISMIRPVQERHEPVVMSPWQPALRDISILGGAAFRGRRVPAGSCVA
jgi:hypothetical protein